MGISDELLFQKFVELEGTEEEVNKIKDDSICQLNNNHNNLSLLGFIKMVHSSQINRTSIGTNKR